MAMKLRSGIALGDEPGSPHPERTLSQQQERPGLPGRFIDVEVSSEPDGLDLDQDEVHTQDNEAFDAADVEEVEQEKSSIAQLQSVVTGQAAQLQQLQKQLGELLKLQLSAATMGQSPQGSHVSGDPGMVRATRYLADSIRQACGQSSMPGLQNQGGTQSNPLFSNQDLSIAKFKMFMNERVKGLSFQAGEKLTSAVVMKWVTSARLLDSAAMKAANRPPVSVSEWQQFFHFYLLHFNDGLYQELQSKVHEQHIGSVTEFWVTVFNVVFPKDLVPDTFDTVLQTYMIWHEPSGVDRWEAVTRMLVRYKEACTGKTGVMLDHAIAEKMYVQMLRVIHHSIERNSQDLLRQFSTYQSAIHVAQFQGNIPSTQLYEQAVSGFLLWLKDWLRLYSYKGTFGHEQGRMIQWGQDTIISPRKGNLRHMGSSSPSYAASEPDTGVSFSQAVSLGDQVEPQLRKMHGSVATRQTQKPTFKPALPQYAPTGKKRTWGWKQSTLSVNGADRQPCNGPAPAEAPAECEYYGDWLDYQGICTYCLDAGHTKQECETYVANVAKWHNAHAKDQEN